MTTSRLILSAMLIATLGLAACGRKAPLDSPYEAGMQARKDAKNADQPLPPEPEKPVEDRPFVLDPLL